MLIKGPQNVCYRKLEMSVITGRNSDSSHSLESDAGPCCVIIINAVQTPEQGLLTVPDLPAFPSLSNGRSSSRANWLSIMLAGETSRGESFSVLFIRNICESAQVQAIIILSNRSSSPTGTSGAPCPPSRISFCLKSPTVCIPVSEAMVWRFPSWQVNDASG